MTNRGVSATFPAKAKGIDISITLWDDDHVSIQVASHQREMIFEVESIQASAIWDEIAQLPQRLVSFTQKVLDER